MNRSAWPHGYQGGYLIGFIMIAVAALRALLFYQDQPSLVIVIGLIGLYTLFYGLEPWLSKRFQGFPYLYFPLQTVLVFTLSRQTPFLDFHTVLYFPLWIQVFRAFSRRAAMLWVVVFVLLLAVTLISGLGWAEGFALALLHVASGAFLASYDFLYSRTQSAQAESQGLLVDLQSAHRRLQEQAGQAEQLAAARERNRLARELHDSVSQVIFSIRLTAQSARLLLEHDPARAAGEIEHLQTMTSDALAQLRSLIADLHPAK